MVLAEINHRENFPQPVWRDERSDLYWSGFIKEKCSGIIDTEKETPENRGNLPI
jgi:hypothetical protein